MAYSDFTLEVVEQRLGVTTQEADLFPSRPSAPVPDWLPGWLARGTRLALISEKARSEFIVVPNPVRHDFCYPTAAPSRDLFLIVCLFWSALARKQLY